MKKSSGTNARNAGTNGRNEIDEIGVLDALAGAKKIALIEPRYERKYLPLGLAKMATFVRRENADAEVRFMRQHDGLDYDLVCVASLFTYNVREVKRTIHVAMAPEDIATWDADPWTKTIKGTAL